MRDRTGQDSLDPTRPTGTDAVHDHLERYRDWTSVPAPLVRDGVAVADRAVARRAPIAADPVTVVEVAEAVEVVEVVRDGVGSLGTDRAWQRMAAGVGTAVAARPAPATDGAALGALRTPIGVRRLGRTLDLRG